MAGLSNCIDFTDHIGDIFNPEELRCRVITEVFNGDVKAFPEAEYSSLIDAAIDQATAAGGRVIVEMNEEVHAVSSGETEKYDFYNNGDTFNTIPVYDYTGRHLIKWATYDKEWAVTFTFALPGNRPKRYRGYGKTRYEAALHALYGFHRMVKEDQLARML